MNETIVSASIRGSYNIVSQSAKKWRHAMDRWGANETVGFPNTTYYLPTIYGIWGIPVEKLGDLEQVVKRCQSLIPDDISEKHSIESALNAGVATLIAEETIEAIRYLENPTSYIHGENITEDNIWMGAADDVILRKRGVEFVDGTASGFAVILGAAPSSEIAAKIALELQRKNIYVFMTGKSNGITFSEQLIAAGLEIGWPVRLIPLGPDTSAIAFAAGFTTKVALSFGGIKPGDTANIVKFNQERVNAFIISLGNPTDEWYANVVGCLNYGFPTIADMRLPVSLPDNSDLGEKIAAGISHDKIVAKAIDVRGLKIAITEIPIPVAYSPAFEGERIRGEDICLESGGGRTPMVEWVTIKQMNEVDDGKIEVIGPEITDTGKSMQLPLAIVVEVAGKQMEKDYEPILERQIHHLINYTQGLMHIGQRDISWLRISKSAAEKGFRLSHLGSLLHAKLHQDFGQIFDKLQMKIYTNKDDVIRISELAKAAYANRDARIEGMTDEATETYYSCTLCQSFAPNHVCIITPERSALCGAYNWLDCKVSYEINPTGPNQPVEKGEPIDLKLGQWKGVNEFLFKTSHQSIERCNLYSIMNDPLTSCGCFECVAAILPMCNGIMSVNREYTELTPCGMAFTTLAGTIGGGIVTPGFLGHGKYAITQKKFISADGGLQRLVWMPKMLKDEISDRLKHRAEEIGISDFPDMIADETIGSTEEEILPFLQEKGHPALTMDSIL